jgi:aryl-alcohol dehydrogenase-like predicted oxidoreductase
LTGCLKSHQKWSTTEGALAWLNKRSVAAITGFSNVLRIEAALGATAKYLSDEEYVYLEERSGATGVEGHC